MLYIFLQTIILEEKIILTVLWIIYLKWYIEFKVALDQ